MDALERAIAGVLDADVDLFRVAERKEEGPALDSLTAAARSIDLEENGEEPWHENPSQEEQRREMAQPREREANIRRRILDTLIEETGGKAKLSMLRLNRGWNGESMGAFSTFFEITRDAYRNWLGHADNRSILRDVRQSETFRTAKEQGAYHTARSIIIDRALNVMGVIE